MRKYCCMGVFALLLRLEAGSQRLEVIEILKTAERHFINFQ